VADPQPRRRPGCPLSRSQPLWARQLGVGCGGEDEPLLVRGHVRTAYRGTLFKIGPPYFVAVYRGDPGDAAEDPVADGETDENGDFTLNANVDDADAQDLFLYVENHGYEAACESVDLPALRHSDGAWVDAETGARVTVRVTVRATSVGKSC
jgi:hypothetical protein